MAKYVLTKTPTWSGVKCSGAGTYTFTLATDLLDATREALDGATQTVNIQEVQLSGAAASNVNITRNAVSILDADPSQGVALNFSQSGFIESVNNTFDIVVTITGNAQIWMKLRKVSGYKSKIEPEQFGSYDNPAVSGS